MLAGQLAPVAIRNRLRLTEGQMPEGIEHAACPGRYVDRCGDYLNEGEDRLDIVSSNSVNKVMNVRPA
jgi:hypothetical protein